MLKTANETTFTAEEIEQIRVKVRAVMEAEGLSQADVARESGVKYGTLTGWLAGTYGGRNDNIAGDVQIWLSARADKKRQAARIPQAPGFQPTPTAAEILDMLGYAQIMPGIVVVAGGAGIGKTRTCEQYAATNPNVWIVTMEPCSRTVYPMLSAIAERLGIAERVMTRLSRAIGRKVEGSGGLLIVDEAQHLDSKALDQLRALHDLYRLGIALVGNEAVYSRLEAEYFDFVKSGCADDESFQQEYMCNPADDDAAFLEYDLIGAVEYPREAAWTAIEGGRLFAGIDIGRKKDLTVLWVVELLGDVLYTRHIEALQNMRKSAQEAILWPWIERCDRTCIDATGLGIGWTDDAQDKFGAERVEGVTFTARVKEALAYPVRGRMEDRRVRIPYQPEIRADLRQVTKQVTAAGNVRFTAERTPDGHADRFWALALAIHAADGGIGDGMGDWRKLGK